MLFQDLGFVKKYLVPMDKKILRIRLKTEKFVWRLCFKRTINSVLKWFVSFLIDNLGNNTWKSHD